MSAPPPLPGVDSARRAAAPYLRPIGITQPARLEFGAGTAAAIGRWAGERGLRRPLVVADGFNVGRVSHLGLSGAEVFGDVRGEPEIATLERLLALGEKTRPDAVIGFGGGSAMDLAKLAAVLIGSGQTFAGLAGGEPVKGRGRALAQVPTTAGTGSEAGTRSLITDPKARKKIAVQSGFMLADLAVIDPDLMLTVPAAVTAATGVDALAHCVEAYTNRLAHPLIDTFALEGARLAGRHLARAVAEGSDREARAGMALASLCGGYCLGPVNTAGGHALAYPLGTWHHLPHGAANALIFPHVLAFNAPAVPERTEAILRALGLKTSAAPAEVLASSHRFCADLGIEMRLSKWGVPRDDLAPMAEEAFAIRRLLDNNPREIERHDIIKIYEAAY